MFPRTKKRDDPQANQIIEERKEILRKRRDWQEKQWKEGEKSTDKKKQMLSEIIQRWQITTAIQKSDRLLKQKQDELRIQQENNFNFELHYCQDQNDPSGAWACCRALAKVAKGGNKTKGYPQTNPSTQDVLNKYKGPTQNGGWEACEVSPEQLNNMANKGERKIINISDTNITEMFKDFAHEAKKSKNRKATANGEIPSEIWRIITNPEWLRPGYKMRTGAGHS